MPFAGHGRVACSDTRSPGKAGVASSRVDAVLQVVCHPWRSIAVEGPTMARHCRETRLGQSLASSCLSSPACSMLRVVRCGTPSHRRACWRALLGWLVSHAVSVRCTDGVGSGVQMRQRLPVRLTHMVSNTIDDKHLITASCPGSKWTGHPDATLQKLMMLGTCQWCHVQSQYTKGIPILWAHWVVKTAVDCCTTTPLHSARSSAGKLESGQFTCQVQN